MKTGRGVRIAVVDSGVASGHPHVGPVAAAFVVVGDDDDDPSDRIGHGTAVAAAIREKAPDAEIVSIRIFHRTLATSARALADGISQAVAAGARLVNLSLGTPNAEHELLLEGAVREAARQGAFVVSARAADGVPWYPGALPAAVGVVADWDCPRDLVRVQPEDVVGPDGRLTLVASPWPRPIPGVPRERNVSGVSFAVANATGFLACLLQGADDVRDLTSLRAATLLP